MPLSCCCSYLPQSPTFHQTKAELFALGCLFSIIFLHYCFILSATVYANINHNKWLQNLQKNILFSVDMINYYDNCFSVVGRAIDILKRRLK